MQPFNRFSQSAESLRPLLSRANELLEMQRVFRRLLSTGLVNVVRPVNWQGETLIVLADHGAAAAKLRQLLPTLLIQLKKQFPKVNAIQIKVQVLPPKPTELRRAVNPMGEQGEQAWLDLHEHLAHTTPLGKAVQSLIAHSMERRLGVGE